ncbi:MAG: fused MFS/spermidine synthase [Candidatus Eisenbacteria bacterium]|uniref:Fused MFS/spermidine synthase n=1 Tax=Eiseniibacteriota bacterium TaxID=2212470 RepID=A0A948RR14_UNCEI|nr:fused MFS/spermidine synthase [Candidatus Eisenbacteria bacterium]MBU1947832.1 fused MFS/spermidine synthase [Candidatus Eisenbacteria bacterium]MBU2689295.1 fused MFS/spermidine synthase [Candidatus Eisenbacteria bacterium]
MASSPGGGVRPILILPALPPACYSTDMNRESDHRGKSFSIHLVIFFTGFTFLIYEVSWNRLLSLTLGTTVTASTIVLSSFMAGFGIGAYFWGRIANDRIQLGKILSALLTGIGITSALNYFILSLGLPLLYSALSRGGTPSQIVEMVAFAIATLLLFVPAFFMGAIFPLGSKIAVKSAVSIPAALGRLYAFETLGSALGGLVAGFILLGTLGQRNTFVFAIIINLSLAIWIFITKRFNPYEMPTQESADTGPAYSSKAKSRGVLGRTPMALKRTALMGAFVCGFAILSLQILWLRVFRIYLTNTSYTFALVSSLAILGLYTGSTIFKYIGHKNDNYQRSMYRIILLMSAVVLLGLMFLIYLPQALMFPFQTLWVHPLLRVLLLPFVAAILIVFPPSVCSGYAFPLACRMYTGRGQNISKDVGFVLMINTIGSVVGPIVAAFVLIPGLGAAISILLVVWLLAGTALLILHTQKSPRKPRLALGCLYAATALLLAVVIVKPDIKILPPSFCRFDHDILYYRESVEGTLTVGQDKGAGQATKYTFVNNSAVIGSTYDAIKVVKMIGHTPFFLGLDCKNALVIGFGIGVTTSAIASHPEVESIECVELVAGLGEAAVFYNDLNQNVMEDPRLKLVHGDGRHYLQMTSKKYDLISCDPTHPILGSGNLYTKDYFLLCLEHLNPGGMVSQYLPLHKLRLVDFLGIISTFHSVFPNSTVWLGHYHAMLLGSTDPIEIDFETWSANIEKIDIDVHFYSDPYHLAANLMLDGATIGKLPTQNRINTDDHSYTEFFAPACLDADNISRNLAFFMERPAGPVSIFKNIADAERMEHFVLGNQLLTKSLYYQLNGDNQRSLQFLRQACRSNPEDQEYPFLMQLYFNVSQ